MADVTVDSLTFRFPNSWFLAKVDDWAFYRRHFQRVQTGLKAVDLLAFEPNGTLWFIEAKDYRRYPRRKILSFIDEFAGKVVSTLAMLIPARQNGSDPTASSYAQRFVGAVSLRLVLHIEQPRIHSKLFPRPVEPANLKQEIRRRLKAIDCHPQVTDHEHMTYVPWEVL